MGTSRKLRIGFAGVGWIGLARMRALCESGLVEVAAAADPDPEARRRVLELASSAQLFEDVDALYELPLDGLVIATPSASHPEQAAQALARGFSVFCQKPLGRTLAETERIVSAARRADRLLWVDLSYRHAAAFSSAQRAIADGELGTPNYARFVFHNAYGPDKPWYYDPSKAGGGCLIDLGTHLVDMLQWMLDYPKIVQVSVQRFCNGEPVSQSFQGVEDLAVAQLRTERGCIVDLACSWRLHAGKDADIVAEVYGPQGGVKVCNIAGSFYDFAAYRMHGTQTTTLVEPPDAWGERAAVRWAEQLARDASFDPQAAQYCDLAELVDRLYQRL